MATKTWGDGVGMDGKWSTATNWTGSAKPIAGDDVVFDGTDTTSCDIDENTANLGSLAATGAYTGTLDGATSDSDVTVAGNVTLACTRVDMGDGTWTVDGSYNDAAVTTFNADASTLKMTGTGKTITSVGTRLFWNLTIDGASITAATNFRILNELVIINTSTFTIAATVAILAGDVQISATGTNSITGAGTLELRTNASISEQNGTINVATLRFLNTHDANIIAGTYASALVCFRGTGGTPNTLKFAAGTYNFSGNVEFETLNAGLFTVDVDTNNATLAITGNLTVQRTSTGPVTVNSTGGTITVGGNFTSTGITGTLMTFSGGTLTVTGTAVAAHTSATNVDASGGTAIDARERTNVNGGNNLNWRFAKGAFWTWRV